MVEKEMIIYMAKEVAIQYMEAMGTIISIADIPVMIGLTEAKVTMYWSVEMEVVLILSITKGVMGTT